MLGIDTSQIFLYAVVTVKFQPSVQNDYRGLSLSVLETDQRIIKTAGLILQYGPMLSHQRFFSAFSSSWNFSSSVLSIAERFSEFNIFHLYIT